MNWRLFRMPDGYTRDSNFPGMLQEGINADSIINCALASIIDYFFYYQNKIAVIDTEHFNAQSSDATMENVVEDLVSNLLALYDPLGNISDIRRVIYDLIPPCYDQIKHMFYTSSIYDGLFKSCSKVESFNTYIHWVDKNTFILLEENERVSIEGIEFNFPFMKDITLLGLGY